MRWNEPFSGRTIEEAAEFIVPGRVSMGVTREQKAAAVARSKRTIEDRDARKKAVLEARLTERDKIWSMDQLESMLVVAAFSVVEDGMAAIPLFDRVERDLAAMKRAEELLQRNKVRTDADLDAHFERARPLTSKERDIKGRARWDPNAKGK